MVHIRLIPLLALFLLNQHCTEMAPEDKRPLNAQLLPVGSKPVEIVISNLNCWIEQDKFWVAGVCSNASPKWQKIWLELSPLNATGKAVALSKHSSVILPVFSDAVPPSGRSSFFMAWPLTEFSGLPATCTVKIAAALEQSAGPILVTPMINSLKLLVAPSAGSPATEEKAWQISGSVSNPLQAVASKPRLELLVYGTDNKLWFSTLLKPEEPATASIFHFERNGPLEPGEDRPFGLQLDYASLPKVLQEKKIGRVEVLPFEGR